MALRGRELRRFSSLAYSPDGVLLAAGGQRQTAAWDASTGRLQWAVPEVLSSYPAGTGKALGFDPRGRIIVSALNDGGIQMRDARDGHPLQKLTTRGNDPCMSVDFSSDGRLLLGGNQSGRIVLWDLSKGHVLREWPAHAKSLTCAIFSPNGKYIASAGADSAGGEGSDDEVRLWDVASGREIRRLFGHHGVICTLAFSPDDRELFTGGRDQTIGVWEVESGTLRHMQRSHAGDVQSLSLNFDGTRLASCSDDHTMTIWNVATSQELQTLNPQAGAILSVAFAPDGTRVAAACPDDALVSVWDARPLTAELRNEIDATNLLATLLPVATSPEDLCRRIRETPLIEESVRKLALERAEADWRSRNGDSAATPLRNWLRRWIPLPTK